MSTHNFSDLRQYYPERIERMPLIFTSHAFIIKLAQAHQREYVEALYSYRLTMHQSTPAPFLNVHRELARTLRSYPQLVEYITEVDSIDIFTNENKCAQWRKITSQV